MLSFESTILDKIIETHERSYVIFVVFDTYASEMRLSNYVNIELGDVTISTHPPPLRLETIMHRSALVSILFLHEVAILDIVSNKSYKILCLKHGVRSNLK